MSNIPTAFYTLPQCFLEMSYGRSSLFRNKHIDNKPQHLLQFYFLLKHCCEVADIGNTVCCKWSSISVCFHLVFLWRMKTTVLAKAGKIFPGLTMSRELKCRNSFLDVSLTDSVA